MFSSFLQTLVWISILYFSNVTSSFRIVHDSRGGSGILSNPESGSRSKIKDSKTKPEEDEVQIVAEIHSPEPQFNPSGHSTILGSTMKKTKPFFISTSEKLHQDRMSRIKPGTITDQLNRKGITARMQFEFSPSNWKAPMWENLSKPTFKRRTNLTPRGSHAKPSCFRKRDFELYKSILDADSPLMSIITNPKSPNSKPAMFSRPSVAPKSPAIQRSYLKDPESARKMIDQLEKHQKQRRRNFSNSPEVINLADDPISRRPKSGHEDNDIVEILDAVSPPKSPGYRSKKSKDKPAKNTLFEELQLIDVCKENYLEELKAKYDIRKQDRQVLIREAEVSADYSRKYADRLTKSVEDRMKKHLSITEIEIPEPEVESSEDEEEPTELPEMTSEMETEIDRILTSPNNQTLVDAHSISITRKDLDTLRGLNWLNDEIINFYLQMIVARSKEMDNWPKVYAMNTFFLPKLRTTGYPTLKRWTRKVDIFSYDIILVPVHLDVHWCLAVINLKKKGVYFYDSMGSDKTEILKLLLKYLESEHMDKKKTPFDTSDFSLENVKDIPRQMNGSDCGMFTLKYSEYLARNAGITFTQEDMPYYRRRMVYEIVNDKIIHP